MTDTKVLVKKRFATAAAWHNWLEEHHAGSRGVWLEFAKKENERLARNFFESLDSKNRYAILYRLHNAKKPETRERRLLKFVQMLKAGETLHERPVKSARRAVQK